MKCCRSSSKPVSAETQSFTRQRSKSRRRGYHRKLPVADTNNVTEDYSLSSDGELSTSVPSVIVGSVINNGDFGSFKRVTCQLANTSVSLMIDLGSKVSLINRSFYDRHLSSNYKLQRPDVNLRAYGGQTIPCMGRVSVPVQFADNRPFEFCFYVTDQGESMMGVDLFDALGGSISLGDTQRSSSVAAVNQDDVITPAASSVSLSQYPVLLKASGQLKGLFTVRQLICQLNRFNKSSTISRSQCVD